MKQFPKLYLTFIYFILYRMLINLWLFDSTVAYIEMYQVCFINS
jgi:hypothetical protein